MTDADAIARLAVAVEKLTERLDATEGRVGRRGRRDVRPLRKLSLNTFVTAIPGLAERTRKVPSSAIEGQEDESLLIRCPCGHHPVADNERLTECSCGRWYVASKGFAYVIYGDMDPPDAA